MIISGWSNFCVGPIGRSFGIIKDRGHLFSEKDFYELPSEVLERFNKLSKSKEKTMFCIGRSEEDNLPEVVNELEKWSLIQASDIMIDIVKKIDPNLSDEKDIIKEFASNFKLLTDIKTEPEIVK